MCISLLSGSLAGSHRRHCYVIPWCLIQIPPKQLAVSNHRLRAFSYKSAKNNLCTTYKFIYMDICLDTKFIAFISVFPDRTTDILSVSSVIQFPVRQVRCLVCVKRQDCSWPHTDCCWQLTGSQNPFNTTIHSHSRYCAPLYIACKCNAHKFVQSVFSVRRRDHKSHTSERLGVRTWETMCWQSILWSG